MDPIIKNTIPSRKEFITNYPVFRYWKNNLTTEIQKRDTLTLYIHIPFCIQQCEYCYYFTLKYQGQQSLNHYVDYICKELDLACNIFALYKREISSIYFGGGTPTLMKISGFEKIINTISKLFSVSNPEITVESSPNLLNKEKITQLSKLGINRLSIGVQSFNNKILNLSGRKHTSEQAIKTIQHVKDTGKFNVNIDLLSGLNGESDSSWKESLKTALSLQPQNLTIYKMQNFSNTIVFDKSVRKKGIYLPTDEEELEFMKIALKYLNESNYKPITYFTFSPGGEKNHAYVNDIWSGKEYCAIGVSSFGMINNFCYQNTNNYDLYFEKIENNSLPIARAYKLHSVDKIIRDILLGLKLCTIDIDRVKEKHGIDLIYLFPEIFKKLKEEKYILIKDRKIHLDKKGVLYGDYVGIVLAQKLRKYFGLKTMSLS